MVRGVQGLYEIKWKEDGTCIGVFRSLERVGFWKLGGPDWKSPE